MGGKSPEALNHNGRMGEGEAALCGKESSGETWDEADRRNQRLSEGGSLGTVAKDFKNEQCQVSGPGLTFKGGDLPLNICINGKEEEEATALDKKVLKYVNRLNNRAKNMATSTGLSRSKRSGQRATV